MANEQNLKIIRTKKRAREIGKLGGQATKAKMAARRTLREELLALLSSNGAQERMSLALYEKACNGDTKAFEVIRDTIGEKPKEVQDVNMNANVNVMPSVKIDGKEFVPEIGDKPGDGSSSDT